MKSYGVTEIDSEESDLSYHLNNLARNGFTILKSGFSDFDIEDISMVVNKTHAKYLDLYDENYLISIDEHNTVRAPFLYDPVYLKISFNDNLMKVVENVLKGNFILNQQNIIINPGGGDRMLFIVYVTLLSIMALLKCYQDLIKWRDFLEIGS